jgi:hypothetical protein
VERYNLDLFVPLEEKRADALATIRVASLLLFDDDFDSFVDLIDSLNPDEDPTPAALMGVMLAKLDSWFRDDAAQERITAVTFDHWQEEDRAVPLEILDLASRGAAFASVGSLLARYGGYTVLASSFAATTEAMFALCDADDDVSLVVDRLLYETA